MTDLAIYDSDSTGDLARSYLSQYSRVQLITPPAHDLTDYWRSGSNLHSWHHLQPPLLTQPARQSGMVGLLILDDWMRDPISVSETRDLLEIFDDRFGRVSTLIVKSILLISPCLSAQFNILFIHIHCYPHHRFQSNCRQSGISVQPRYPGLFNSDTWIYSNGLLCLLNYLRSLMQNILEKHLIILMKEKMQP